MGFSTSVLVLVGYLLASVVPMLSPRPLKSFLANTPFHTLFHSSRKWTADNVSITQPRKLALALFKPVRFWAVFVSLIIISGRMVLHGKFCIALATRSSASTNILLFIIKTIWLLKKHRINQIQIVSEGTANRPCSLLRKLNALFCTERTNTGTRFSFPQSTECFQRGNCINHSDTSRDGG